jgi:hypothetical protein
MKGKPGRLARRLHVAQHRVAGNAPQQLRLWSTIALVIGWAVIGLGIGTGWRFFLVTLGSLLILGGVAGHLAAIQIEDIHEDEKEVDW